MFSTPPNVCECACVSVTVYVPLPTSEVVVLLAVSVSEGDQLSEKQGVLKHPLHRFNQVGLQGG